ncbi:hypothetical protein AMATHDRAFT_134140 [Amanita thiersii Skay4041]|uniref:Anaphase-promoting complex subunit 4 n=1 Tax=Amanita thiersii Skay4041 TaxID=703135 RepID=A0A2A9NY61_9AGAR|nr:hypothetical protein AMATHDRAFT_134140 [Amanita thiersii Skay4041]
MQTNAFTALAVLQLPSQSRLLCSSCCPDKDLLLLISRLGGQDRVSLWNSTQGTKTWEVDIGDENSGATVVDVAWSPDGTGGQSVVVLHDPPQITLHSVQDGRRLMQLPILSGTTPQIHRQPHFTGIWWFRDDKAQKTSAIPDIFKRNDVITGSTLSVLRILPLLDRMQEEERLTATDLFAFQGSQTRPSSKSQLPDVIRSWPTLTIDTTLASIESPVQGTSENKADMEESSINSILVASDDSGGLHCFLDGTFQLGPVSLRAQLTISSLTKLSGRPVFLAHLLDEASRTDLKPSLVELPLLSGQKFRNLAMLSSTARELVWYIMRAVKEMKTLWFGGETVNGARELGPKWVRGLEEKQREQYGQEEPTPILDLTCLLLTGRASESLLDYLGSGEKMSERGIQKWETTMAETLAKLRDFSEKRVAPACQRLHLVLEELHGWSHLKQYNPFELSMDELNICLDLTGRSVVIASWLAGVARRELSRFKEFISWLRFETSVIANTANDSNSVPKHDILEVNNYFMSGLVVSSIDKWFMGPVPSFSPRDLGLPGDGYVGIQDVLEKARSVLDTPGKVTWQVNGIQKDLSHLDRNLDALVHELVMRCGRIFNHAACAASRSSVVSLGHDSALLQADGTRQSDQLVDAHFAIRERTALHEGGEIVQHLASVIPSEQPASLMLIRLRFNNEADKMPCEVGFIPLECCLSEEGKDDQVAFDLLETDFFDDELMVIVYRLRNRDKSTFIATVKYNDLGYQPLVPDVYVKAPAREDLMQYAMGQWKSGNIRGVGSPIKRCRGLKGCKTGRVYLAVNGRVGRRVACVLDGKGTTVETFDMEGEGDEMETEEEEI